MLARQGRSAQKVVQDRCCSYSLACLFRDRRVLSGWVLVYGLSPSRFPNTQNHAGEWRSEGVRISRESRGSPGLQHAWLCEASGEEFDAKRDELIALTEEYRKLPERRKQKVRDLERALYETQLRHYLEQFDIASADIPHIKERRKAMLSAYGIDDAADVLRSTLETVPGFGYFLIIQHITGDNLWRQLLNSTLAGASTLQTFNA
jgi:hypothetical protein